MKYLAGNFKEMDNQLTPIVQIAKYMINYNDAYNNLLLMLGRRLKSWKN